MIYGAGGHARELRAQLELEGHEVVAFIDDFNHDRSIDGTPVIKLTDPIADTKSIKWLIGIGERTLLGTEYITI